MSPVEFRFRFKAPSVLALGNANDGGLLKPLDHTGQVIFADLRLAAPFVGGKSLQPACFLKTKESTLDRAAANAHPASYQGRRRVGQIVFFPPMQIQVEKDDAIDSVKVELTLRSDQDIRNYLKPCI